MTNRKLECREMHNAQNGFADRTSPERSYTRSNFRLLLVKLPNICTYFEENGILAYNIQIPFSYTDRLVAEL